MGQPHQNNYADTHFEPCLHYKRDFDLDAKAPMHTMTVEFGKMVEIEGEDDDDENVAMVKKVLQKKETIRKFQGKSAEELLYTMDEFFTTSVWNLNRNGKNGQRSSLMDKERFGKK